MAKKEWGKVPLSNNLLIDDEKRKQIEIAKNIDNADELELWAASSYVIDTNPVLFYKATHNDIDESLSERSLLMKAKQWVNSPRITQIVNFAKKSMLASDYITPSMRRALDNENKEKAKKIVGKDDIEFEDAIKLIENFLKRPDIENADFKDVKGALDMLAKFKGWLSDNEENIDDFYEKTTIAFFPYDCDKCVRAKGGMCKKCMYHRESTGNLTEEERKWIKEKDSWN